MSKKQLTESQAKASEGLSEKATAEPGARRGWLLGLGAAGAAAVAVKVLPGAPVEEVVAVSKAAPAEASGGYQLSPHVLRYYETARS
ncbi:formate dehydrogenase [Paucibacter sp. Y2R2-4]|uniref:formate dehydrogenase n=1 Tax=Paucibacter sp. Y2R2-4 TaxID=2893553 RepID=UPI0021E3AE3C|nr:formate dehydrogenase [Paucibacter sp. Y2R2-4]MCV2349005.1 formate dehydrogenase [Paucibacter sp. Y2R2-4]